MLSIDEAYAQVSKFYNAHKGLEGTTFEVYEIQEDAFPQASFRWHKNNTVTGAFLSDSNTVIIIANNNRSMEELNKTLRHEVFGHYALNVISNQDKVALLETISNAPDDSEIGKHRDTLASTFYSNLKDKPLLLAEEVYAHTAERSFEEIEHFISVPDPRSVESEKDLLSFISSVKNGIHHGVLNYNSTEDEKIKLRAIESPKEVLVLAEASEDVYNEKSESDILEPLSSHELLSRNIDVPLEIKKIGAKAEVYRDNDENIILAYTGTRNAKDWFHGNSQGLGLDVAQYRHAVKLGKQVNDAFQGDVTVTGHSLGGGKGSLVAAIIGARAVTFNAAGVHKATLKREFDNYTEAYENNIDAYSVKGEILTAFQDYTFAPKALGNRKVLIDPTRANTINRHSMEAVKRAINYKIQTDLLSSTPISSISSEKLSSIVNNTQEGSLLEIINLSKSPHVQDALANNKYTPQHILESLAINGNSKIKQSIISNDGASLELIYALSKDENKTTSTLANERLRISNFKDLNTLLNPKIDENKYEHVEGFIAASLDVEMQTEEGLQRDTRKRILDYASLMGDTELEAEVDNTNMESLETLKEYFTQLDKGEYLSYDDFVEENQNIQR